MSTPGWDSNLSSSIAIKASKRCSGISFMLTTVLSSSARIFSIKFPFMSYILEVWSRFDIIVVGSISGASSIIARTAVPIAPPAIIPAIRIKIISILTNLPTVNLILVLFFLFSVVITILLELTTIEVQNIIPQSTFIVNIEQITIQ